MADAEALTCEACGYVGLKTNHTGEPVPTESWTEALQRFHDDS